MAWSRTARKGAWFTALGTIIVTAFSVAYLWFSTYGWDGVTTFEFIKIAVVTSLVWFAIGTTMAIFIVMVLEKNEKFKDS